MTTARKGRNGLRHRLFLLGMVFKGLDGLLELSGGILLLAFGPHRLNHMLMTFTQHELEDGPNDLLSRLLSHVHSFSGRGVHFAAIYLLFQGGVKIALVTGLVMEKRWVFPVALVLMSLFELYMIVRLTMHPGLGLAILFTLNLIIIVLIWREYRDLPQVSAA